MLEVQKRKQRRDPTNGAVLSYRMGTNHMSIQFLYFLFVLKIIQIFRKHSVSEIIFHDEGMFAVYYDEKRDKLRYMSLMCTVVYESNGTRIYRPLLQDQERVNRNWIFLEVSEEIKPMSYYSDAILDKLVKKVRRAMGAET